MPPLSSILRKKNSVFYPLSIGYNHTRGYHKHTTTHAEMDAIDRLKNRVNKKPIKVDIMVIRVNNSGHLCSSQPCHKCVEYMKNQARQKGYKIHRIYYSTSEGNIESSIL